MEMMEQQVPLISTSEIRQGKKVHTKRSRRNGFDLQVAQKRNRLQGLPQPHLHMVRDMRKHHQQPLTEAKCGSESVSVLLQFAETNVRARIGATVSHP
jgi:hypothetical protein